MFKTPTEKLFQALIDSNVSRAYSLLEKNQNNPYIFDETIIHKGEIISILSAFFFGKKMLSNLKILTRFMECGYRIRFKDTNQYGVSTEKSSLHHLSNLLLMMRSKNFPINIPTGKNFQDSYDNACYFFQTQARMLNYLINDVFGHQNMSFHDLKKTLNLVFADLEENKNTYGSNIFSKIQTNIYTNTFLRISINQLEFRYFFIPILYFYPNKEIGEMIIKNWSTFIDSSENVQSNSYISNIIEKALEDETFKRFFEAQCKDKKTQQYFDKKIPSYLMGIIETKSIIEQEQEKPKKKVLSLKIEEEED